MKRPSSPHASLPRALAVALCLLLLAPGAALAQCPKTGLAELEKEVMCPVCGTPLALAEVSQAEEQREFIQERIDRCQSEEEIKAALVAEFGPGVLATPGGGGFDALGYLLPALAVLGGIAAIAVASVRWRRSRAARAAPEPGGSAPAASSAESSRLEADLGRYDL